jgi:protein-disulfide isomerase
VTTDQVFSALELAYNVWETASTGGGNQVAKKAGGEVDKKKLRDELKDWMKEKVKDVAKEQAKEHVKATFESALKTSLDSKSVPEEAKNAVAEKSRAAGGMLYRPRARRG